MFVVLRLSGEHNSAQQKLLLYSTTNGGSFETSKNVPRWCSSVFVTKQCTHNANTFHAQMNAILVKERARESTDRCVVTRSENSSAQKIYYTNERRFEMSHFLHVFSQMCTRKQNESFFFFRGLRARDGEFLTTTQKRSRFRRRRGNSRVGRD